MNTHTPIRWLRDDGLVDVLKTSNHEVQIFDLGRENGLTGQTRHRVVINTSESKIVIGDLETARAAALDRLVERFDPEARESLRILNEEQAQVELARLGVGS